MTFFKAKSAIFLTLLIATTPNAFAYEEAVIVTTGLGISSPSFHDGLNGENPAGLVANTSSKITAELHSDNNKFSNPKGLAGVLIGNGHFGAGLELQKNNSSSQVNWGVAGRIAPIFTTLGVSGHHAVPGTKGTYDAGMNIELSKSFQMGIAGFGLSSGPDVIGAGFLWDVDNMLSFVVDGARDLQNDAMVVASGFALNMNRSWVLSASYAYQLTDLAVAGKHAGIRAGVGIRIIQPLLLKYEYNDQALHNLGLSIRF